MHTHNTHTYTYPHTPTHTSLAGSLKLKYRGSKQREICTRKTWRKRSIMQGVCALNMEAMSMWDAGDSTSNHGDENNTPKEPECWSSTCKEWMYLSSHKSYDYIGLLIMWQDCKSCDKHSQETKTMQTLSFKNHWLYNYACIVLLSHHFWAPYIITYTFIAYWQATSKAFHCMIFPVHAYDIDIMHSRMWCNIRQASWKTWSSSHHPWSCIPFIDSARLSFCGSGTWNACKRIDNR